MFHKNNLPGCHKMKRFLCIIIAVFCLMTILYISAAQAETTLKLNGVVERYIGDFLDLHPDVTLDGENYKYYATTEELASDLLLQSFDYDVFEVSNARMDYRTIMKKGYCLDLSESEIIQNAMERLQPVFAQQCIMDGKIYAIPFTFQLNYLALSQSMLERVGLDGIETPTTFPVFLDFLEQWLDHLKANPDCDVALLGMAYWGDASYYGADAYTAFLVEQLLENYMMQKSYAGETLNFDDSVLIPLLDRCYQLGHELYRYDAGIKTNNSLLENIASIAMDGYDFLSLRLDPSQPKLVQIYVNLYAVNADTKHPALCIELMEALCINNWPMYNTYLYQDGEPLIDPQYDSRVSKMQQLIEDTQRELSSDTLDVVYRGELEDRLQRQQSNLQKLLENEDAKYLVTAEDLTWFQSHEDCMFVQMPSVFNPNNVENANAYKQLQARYATGQISAKELVMELDRMAWMIEMEVQ